MPASTTREGEEERSVLEGGKNRDEKRRGGRKVKKIKKNRKKKSEVLGDKHFQRVSL